MRLNRYFGRRRQDKARRRLRDEVRRRRPRAELLEDRLLLAQDLLLTDYQNDRILRFDAATGAPSGNFVASGSGGLVGPNDPTFGPDGNLYLISTESGNEKILRYDGDDGSFIDTFIDTGQGGFNGAAAIEFGPDGDLYVATNATDGVLRYDGVTGAFESAIAAGEVARASGLAFGPDNNLYVMDSDGFLNTFADRITRYDLATGNLIDEFVAPGNLEDVAYFTFGPDGHIYVPDVLTSDIRLFSGYTGEIRGLLSPTDDPSKPVFQVVFGPDGYMYVANENGISRLDSETGQYLAQWTEGVSGTFTFMPAGNQYNLEVQSVEIPDGVIVGEDLSITYSVQNSSDQSIDSANWDDVFYLSEDREFDPSDIEIGRVAQSRSLGSTSTYEQEFSTPLTSPFGEFYVIVVTDRRGQVADTQRGNNILASSQMLQVHPRVCTSHEPGRSIAVGRTLSDYSSVDLIDGELSIEYSVYNLTGCFVDNVLLTAELGSSVEFVNSSRPPNYDGKTLAWSLGTIEPYAFHSVNVAVSIDHEVSADVDRGANAYGAIGGNFVVDDLPAASLFTSAVPQELLSSTLDANSDDALIQRIAAELDQDATKIIPFVQRQIGFESYHGSLRGARGTLWSNAGNALDQSSLLVGILRASGIPARYATGVLPDSVAQDIVMRMFSPPNHVGGFIEGNTAGYNPTTDLQLLNETRNHFWVEFTDSDLEFQPVDPVFFETPVGQTVTTTDETFSVVPEELRHTVTINLDVEITNTATTLFGVSGQSSKRILSEAFVAADLFGKQLSIGHFTNSHGFGTSLAAAVTHTYSPYISIGDAVETRINEEEIIRGLDYQEVLSNFLNASVVATGLFLEVVLDGPQVPTETHQRALIDRIGYATRTGRGPSDASVDPNQGRFVSEFDVFTLNVLAGRTDPEFPGAIQSELLKHAQSSGPVATSVITRALSLALLHASDASTQRIANDLLVKAYFDRPRLLLVSHLTRLNESGELTTDSFGVDLIRNSIRAIAYPGQAAHIVREFLAIRGLAENVIETEVPETLLISPPEAQEDFLSVSTVRVFESAAQQDIPLVVIGIDDLATLDTLSIDQEAIARITDSVLAGQSVVVPIHPVAMGHGISTTAWYRIGSSGEVVGVIQNGTHGFKLRLPGPKLETPMRPLSYLIDPILEPDEAHILEGKKGLRVRTQEYFANLTAVIGTISGLVIGFNLVVKASEDAFKNVIKILDQLSKLSPAKVTQQLEASLGVVDARQLSGFQIGESDIFESLERAGNLVLTGLPSVVPLFNPQVDSPFDQNNSFAYVPVPSTFEPGDVGGIVQADGVRVRGLVDANWTSDQLTQFFASSFTSANGRVVDANGVEIGSGTVSFLADTDVSVEVGENAGLRFRGFADLVVFPIGPDALGAGGGWSDFYAELTSASVITVTTDSLELNGAPLLANTYTIHTANADFFGSDINSAPTFSQTLQLSVQNADIQTGSSGGSLTIADDSTALPHDVTLQGYFGSLKFDAAGSNVTTELQGSFGDVLSISAPTPPGAVRPGTSVSFPIQIDSTRGGVYRTNVTAPPDWNVEIDNTGTVTIIPAPGTEDGEYVINLDTRLVTDPGLIAHGTVTVAVQSSAIGLQFEIERDTMRAVPHDGALVPSAFMAQIHNDGADEDVYDLTVSNVPIGFRAVTSVNSISVLGGAYALVGAYLVPDGPLPVPGTDASFEVTISSQTNLNIVETAGVTYQVPEIYGLRVDTEHREITAVPGLATELTLTVSSTGNVDQSISFTSSSGDGLVVTELQDAIVEPGGESKLTVSVTPDIDTPLNSYLRAQVVATESNGLRVPLTIYIRIAAPGALSMANAANSADQLGRGELAEQLRDLSLAVTELVENPGRAIVKAQVLANLESVAALVSVVPELASMAVTIRSNLGTLADAITPETTQLALQQIGDVFIDFRSTIGNLASHQFDLTLTPNTLIAQPLVPAPFLARVHNLGTQPTNYSLALAGVPDRVTATLDQNTLTLDPGEFADVPGSLLQASTTELIDFEFTVDVAVTGTTTEINQSAIGAMRPRNEIVSIADVDVAPPFGDPGTQVNINARLLNAVNREQDSLVSYSVTDPGGATVYELPTPVPTSLTVQTSLVNVDLGPLDTTGYAQGQHTIKVTVFDADGFPIPRATATSPLIIGSPVEATLTVGPQVLPPGVSTVASTLHVSGDVPIGVGTLKLVGMLPIEEFKGNQDNVDSIQGITLNGDTAYVHGFAPGIGSLHVVDISDPKTPVRSRAETGIVSTSGAIDGDRLFAVDAGTNASGVSTLHVFDLNGGSGGTADDPQLRDSISVPYIHGQDIEVSGDSVFTAQAQVLFNGSNILEQNGTVLSFDVTDPADLQLLDSLFSVNGTTEDGNPNMGGNFFTRAIAIADPTTMLVASSTSTGNDAQSGTGRLLIVDVSDAAAINSDNVAAQNAVMTELSIPGTTLIADVVVHEEMAYVIGSTGGFNSGDVNDQAPTGELVVASINISDPFSPVLTHTETLSRAARGALNLSVLGPGWLAITSLGETATDTPQIITLDVSDPSSFSFDQQIDLSGVPSGLASDGAYLYATQSDGLFVYEMRPDDPLELLGVTAIPGPIGVAARDDIAYVCGMNGISVLDYSDPTNPTTVNTVGSGEHRGCRLNDDLLVALSEPFNATVTVSVYSIQSDSLDPVFLGKSSPIAYANLKSGLELTDSHAYVTQFGVCVQTRPATNKIVGLMGELLTIELNLDDPQNPTAATPSLVNALFNHFGDNNTEPTNVLGCTLSGGDHNVFGITLAEPGLAYLAAGSATTANPGAGIGQIHVVDTSDASNTNVIRDLDIPGTGHAMAIGIDGARGIVVGSTTGWNDPFDGNRSGTLTVTSLDLSDPLDPQIITTKVLDRQANTFWTNFETLGDGLFAFSSRNFQGGTDLDARLLLIDVSNPLDPYVIETGAELDTTPPNSITSDGDLLFTTDAGGVSIYRIGDLPRIPFTAQVQIPRDSGVSTVEASFNLPPDHVVSTDPDFDTLIWHLALTPDSEQVELSWDSVVTGLQPGESRDVTFDSTIDFTYQAAPGQISLPTQNVFAEQILAIDPAASTVQPGGEASFTITVTNPRDVEVTYDLSGSGVPADWMEFALQAIVPAGGAINIPLTLKPDSNARPGHYGFVITATSNGTTGEVESTLAIAGDAVVPEFDSAARGVFVELDPTSFTAGQGTPATFTARVYNTGNVSDEFVLFAGGLPAEFITTINAGIFSLPPGARNFREYSVQITPPAGSAAANYPFTVTAASVDHLSITGAADGLLTVADIGVAVDIIATSSDPDSSVQMTVTNTGSVVETFDISVAAPAALVATTGMSTVTLQPGQSQTVTIDIGEIDFAFPGVLQLVGAAMSQKQPAVMDADAIDVDIAGVRGVAAKFEHDTRTLSLPGDARVLLMIDNVGNLEDQYSARIISSSGPVNAALTDADGEPTQEVSLFILPGLSRGAILLDAELTGFGEGTVTVQVTSLSDDTIVAEDTVAIMTEDEFDFGDAPEAIFIGDLNAKYLTLSGSGGPRHARIEGAPLLGTMIDVEDDGQPSELADGDGFDEDGVIQIASFVSTSSQSTLGSVLVEASADAKLDAWIDFNRNGQFDHPAEHLGLGTSIDLASGSNIVPVNVPAGAFVGTTFARFRISTLGNLGPGGQAADGEVEDYSFEILDGDARANLVINMVTGDVKVAANNNDIVVLFEDTELFRAGGTALASASFLGTDADNTLAMEDWNQIVGSPIHVSYHAGNGVDGFQITDQDQSVDLTDTDQILLRDVEIIDLAGGGSNTLVIAPSSVLESTNIENMILVIHDDDDTVNYLGGNWTVEMPVFVDGSQRHRLVDGDAIIETLNTRPWTNPYIATDVNRSGNTTPIDALIVINFIATNGSDAVELLSPAAAHEIGDAYFDVNHSEFASPLDALNAINFLARQQVDSGALGELVARATSTTNNAGDAPAHVLGGSPIAAIPIMAGKTALETIYASIANQDEQSRANESNILPSRKRRLQPNVLDHMYWADNFDRLRVEFIDLDFVDHDRSLCYQPITMLDSIIFRA